MKHYDYLIVGQGIAGTAFSYILHKRSKKFLVIDGVDKIPSSSRVAGGIFNPLTGKKLVKTWQADQLFPFLKQFYSELETVLNQKFLHFTSIYRPFRNIEEQNEWTTKGTSPDFIPYLNLQVAEEKYSSVIYNPYGGIETLQGGWLDVPVLLEAYRNFLLKKEAFQETILEPSEISFKENLLLWRDISFRRIIYCEGVRTSENIFFKNLPFTPVKGEIIDIAIKGLPAIINQGVSVVPLSGNQARIASTYDFIDKSWQNSIKAQDELMQEGKKILKVPFEFLEQRAGLRPATKPRRPFIGTHPLLPQVGIFNGLGSKGVSLAPYWAEQFYKHLEENHPLDLEVDIQKYYK